MITGVQSVGTIKPFDGTGFSNWVSNKTIFGESGGVRKVIEQNVSELANAEEQTKCRQFMFTYMNIIVQFVSDNLLEMIKGKNTTKGIIDELRGTFQKQGIANKVQSKES